MQDGATNDNSEIREIGNTPSSLLSDPIQLHMPMLQPMLRPTGALVNMWVQYCVASSTLSSSCQYHIFICFYYIDIIDTILSNR